MKLAHFDRRVVALTVFWILLYPLSLAAAPYYAVSLNATAGKLKERSSEVEKLQQLGGITRLLGAVYNQQSPDVIIFGQAVEGEPALCLDDLVLALRAIFIHDASPLVSIDKTETTRTTQKQTVRFEGGIAGTKFGQDLLAADGILKKMGLGHLPTEVWGSKSYFDLIGENWQKNGKEHRIQSRFWFKPADIFIASRSGVAILERFRVSVQTQILQATADGKQTSGFCDDMGDQFAGAMSNNFEDLMQYYKELKQLRPLFNLVGVATGIKKLAIADPALNSSLDFWLKIYQVPACETPTEYPLVSRTEQLHRQGQAKQLTIDGGIELKAFINDINDGVIEALRDVLIKTRPHPAAWRWRVPLEGWHAPGSASEVEGKNSGRKEANDLGSDKKIGCTFSSTFSAAGKPVIYKDLPFQPTLPPPAQVKSEVNIANSLTPQRYSPQVGGVMLQGAAKVAAGAGARVDLSSGNFSLVVEGENARLAPEAFRKFITALWSVYYTEQDPGISIDPIERGGKKHLVRYIGSVVNNDLGRVMREADYIMKKWAVGTEKPNIPGFKDVDALSARHGLRYVGASRRFWFVPEEMRFKRGGEMLLFDQGRMTLKTEYRFQDKAAKAEPADKAFAKFFTEHYPQIAGKYHVYRELFDYAKMVSLAKYLKEQGVPLHWFLMANKDLVLTEDSPGTVDALAKGSRHFEGIQIEGGVNLGFKGQYVYDQQASQAISQAVARSREHRPEASTKAVASPGITPGQPTESVSFQIGQKNFTAVPQHSLTSGRDRRGLRYQTDLAFRQGNQPGLELVRYFNSQRQEAGEFGNGWHLLIPYRLKPAGEAKRKFLNAVIPEKIALWNLISGEQEVLTFSTDRYSVAGYVPQKLAQSQVVGLFLMSDASYRLADKLGNEFWFDQAGLLTDMIFSREHRIHFDYLRDIRDLLAYAAHQVKPADAERVNFLNLRLPKRMKVTDLNSGDSQVLTFNAQGDRVGYVPRDEGGKYRLLALMNDTSFRLLLRDGTEIPLDRTGAFAGKASLPDHPLAKAISIGNQKISFAYTFGKTGNILISRAYWQQEGKDATPVCLANYEYDAEGRLARVASPEAGRTKVESGSLLTEMLARTLDPIQR
ncbi:MAG: hypothetical protein C4567_13715 [Deltaproteobacteria bacterium]|nr:MAG: hypothetical protein C4567_13715 [Deltaproteobacteria bacterium]